MKASSLIKPYLRENIKPILLGFMFLVLVDGLQLFIPRIIKRAIDDLAYYRADTKGLLMYAGLIVGAAVLIGVFRYAWRRCLIGTSRRIEEGLRNRLFGHIQSLSADYFSKTSTGSLMAHATNDIKNVRMATGMGMVALTDAVFLGSMTIFFMLWIDRTLALFALIPMPFIVVCARMFSRIMHTRYKDVQAGFADVTEEVRERLAGIRIVKAYTREQESYESVFKRSDSFVDKNIGLVRITGTFFPMMMLLTNASLIIVIYLGGRLTILGEISPGDFVAFISYLGLLTWPMMALGWMTNLVQRGRASLDRIGSVLSETPSVNDAGHINPDSPVQGDLAFTDVSFSFNESSESVLNQVTLSVPSGTMLGIAGPPGAGKTTFLNLIPRLYDSQSGTIHLDNTDISEYSLRFLRDQFSFMPQEPFLFEGTIRENILIGKPETTEEALISAVKAASFYETVQSFKDGFETLVGEKGVILSGGQKQRVALARALLHDKPILLLDDPVSQVDTETESIIVDMLKQLKGKKTIIASSHRLSVFRHADSIAVFTDGHVSEFGNHEELLDLGGYYSRTFRLQETEETLNAD